MKKGLLLGFLLFGVLLLIGSMCDPVPRIIFGCATMFMAGVALAISLKKKDN